MSDWDNDGDDSFNDELFGEDYDTGPAAADTANPLISAEQDAEMHSPVVEAGGVVSLVAVFDEQGQPQVSRTVMENGKPRQLEAWRRPTPDEYNSIMFDGKIVRGGVVGTKVPAGTNLDLTLRRAPLGAVGGGVEWKRVAGYTAASLAIVGAGWGIYQWRKGK